MRLSRIISFIAALALLTFLPFVSPAGASAAPSTESVSPAVSARAAQSVGAKIVKERGRLIMKGRVKPAKGPVTIQRATKCNQRTGVCNFRFFKKTPVRNGGYSIQVYAPNRGNLYWRARVGKATSDVWKTFKS